MVRRPVKKNTNGILGRLFISAIPFLLGFALLRITVSWLGYAVVPAPVRAWFADRYGGPGGLRRQPYKHWSH